MSCRRNVRCSRVAAAFAAASRIIPSDASMPVTRQPRFAISRASVPVPHATSSIVGPEIRCARIEARSFGKISVLKSLP